MNSSPLFPLPAGAREGLAGGLADGFRFAGAAFAGVVPASPAGTGIAAPQAGHFTVLPAAEGFSLIPFAHSGQRATMAAAGTGGTL